MDSAPKEMVAKKLQQVSLHIGVVLVETQRLGGEFSKCCAGDLLRHHLGILKRVNRIASIRHHQSGNFNLYPFAAVAARCVFDNALELEGTLLNLWIVELPGQ